MLMKHPSWSDAPHAVPEQRALRHGVASLLSAASAALAHIAQRLLHVEAASQRQPVLEFYADAGAPEGALYVDGRLVGHIAGVSRL